MTGTMANGAKGWVNIGLTGWQKHDFKSCPMSPQSR